MIFFDIDATLLDDAKAVRSAFKEFILLFPTLADRSFARAEAVWNEQIPIHFSRFLKGEISYQNQLEERVRSFLAKMTVEVSNEKIVYYANQYLKYYQTAWSLFDDVTNCLASIDIPMGIITNGQGSQQREKLKYTNISDYFSVCICADEVKCPKPNIEIFVTACKIANVSPRNTWYVGDNYTTDIIGSYNAGMQPIWLNRNKLFQPTDCLKSAITIERLDQLTHIISNN